MSINVTPITQFAQILRAAELSKQQEVKIPIVQARMIDMALTEILDKMNQDYDSLIRNLSKSNHEESVTINLDGGSF